MPCPTHKAHPQRRPPSNLLVSPGIFLHVSSYNYKDVHFHESKGFSSVFFAPCIVPFAYLSALVSFHVRAFLLEVFF